MLHCDEGGARVNEAKESDKSLVSKGRKTFPSGATSNYAPGYHRIPKIALDVLAERLEHGETTHGQGASNRFKNTKRFGDSDWVMDRLNHGIEHSLEVMGLLDHIMHDRDSIELMKSHAGAIMFAGMLLAAHAESCEEDMKKRGSIGQAEALSKVAEQMGIRPRGY